MMLLKKQKDLDDSLDNQKNIEINVNKIRDNLKTYVLIPFQVNQNNNSSKQIKFN